MEGDILPCCLRCGGYRIIPGRFNGEATSIPVFFRHWKPGGPWREYFASIGLGRSVAVGQSGEAFFCLNCGTAWTMIDRDQAEASIRLRGYEELKSRLGLVDKPHARDQELA